MPNSGSSEETYLTALIRAAPPYSWRLFRDPALFIYLLTAGAAGWVLQEAETEERFCKQEVY